MAKLAISSQDTSFIGASARFFHILINGEVDGLLESKTFARSLIDLVRQCSGASHHEEANLVELLFGVATKIRLDSELLPAWFHPEEEKMPDKDSPGSNGSFVGATRRNEFPLFYLFVGYVYHDGQLGDFARTGLLQLIEAASKLEALERWLIESDLATLMASGLGALYSRLSRRLRLDRVKLPFMILSSDGLESLTSEGVNIPDSQEDVEAFLSFLLFWQDALDHCASEEITDNLLDHFQVLFLQQVLYPSLLESSDSEGESDASVITYLYRMLECLEHPVMVQMVLKYLLASRPQPKPYDKSRPRLRMSLSRRKSLDVLATFAEKQKTPSPDLFNLVDLIAMSLKSRKPRTVAATMKLITVIIRKHHRFAIHALFNSSSIAPLPHRGISTHNSVLQKLFYLAGSFSETDIIDQTYGHLLRDVQDMLGTHSCALTDEVSGLPANGKQKLLKIVEDDVVINELATTFYAFFTNSAIVNLALTETVVAIASCRLISLDGWLLPRMSNATGENEPTLAIASILGMLVEGLAHWRAEIPDWDAFIRAQRAKLMDDIASETDNLGSKSCSPQTPPDSRGVLSARSSTPKSVTLSGHQTLESKNSSSARRAQESAKARHTRSDSSFDGPFPMSLNLYETVPSSPYTGLLSKDHVRLPSSTTTSTSVTFENAWLGRDPFQRRLNLSKPLAAQIDTPQRAAMADLGTNHFCKEGDKPDSSSESTPSGANPATNGDDPDDGTKSVTLSHMLTNAIILRDFVLEIAAVVQIRGTMFGEVSFEGEAMIV